MPASPRPSRPTPAVLSATAPAPVPGRRQALGCGLGLLASATGLPLALQACGGGSSGTPPGAPTGLRLVPLLSGLQQPWGLAFLPDGQMLVSQRSGELRRLAAEGRSVLADISGVPAVRFEGQGGLLDVVLHPDYASNGWLYLAYAEWGSGSEAGLSGTAVARARLRNDTLVDLQLIYRQTPKTSGSGHYGCRLAFDESAQHLYIALGDRQLGSPAQDLSGTLGKVVRLHADGRVPADNPALGSGSRPEIWSLGHRNPQGIARRPGHGDPMWLVEHGPQGGDELNRVARGGNHGWPLRSYGCNYGDPVGDGCRIGGGTHAPTHVEPVSIWVPTSTAPSSLLFYTGERFPAWRGQAFIGALAGQTLWRITLDEAGREVSRDEPLGPLGKRVRWVGQGPDGWIYLLTDDGGLWRIEGD